MLRASRFQFRGYISCLFQGFKGYCGAYNARIIEGFAGLNLGLEGLDLDFLVLRKDFDECAEVWGSEGRFGA